MHPLPKQLRFNSQKRGYRIDSAVADCDEDLNCTTSSHDAMFASPVTA